MLYLGSSSLLKIEFIKINLTAKTPILNFGYVEIVRWTTFDLTTGISKKVANLFS